MVKIQMKTLCLCVCVLEAVWLLLAQTLGSIVLLAPCLIAFLVLSAWAALQNMAIPVCLFFLPFAPLLKLVPRSMSFYTMALLLVYAIYMVKGIRNIRILHLIPALALIILTLVVKILSGYAIDNTYILFSISLLLIPFMATEIDGRYDFYWLVLLFSVGVILSAVTSQFLVDFSSIARYINVVNEMGINRHSGYYSDPNFYSAHITAALGGVLVLLLQDTDRIRRTLLTVIVVMLLYCGLLSISKSFLLVCVCLLVCWFLMFMLQKGRLSAKVVMIIMLIVVAMFILSSTVFTDLLDLIVYRFSDSSNLSALTTNRVDVWANYLREFRRRPLLLWFGNGYSAVLFSGYAAHNTVIQTIYQFGLLGAAFLITWFVFFCRNMLANITLRQCNMTKIAILLLGALGPWMGLDYLFFDELFIIPLYLCAAICLMSNTPASAASLE